MNEPIHSPRHEFTSTLGHEKSTMNVWIVIITAIIFFVILSWYNAILSAYNYAIGYNPTRVKDPNRLNLFSMVASLGYAIIWTIIAVISYYILLNAGLLYGENIGSHPSTRGELNNISRGDPLALI